MDNAVIAYMLHTLADEVEEGAVNVEYVKWYLIKMLLILDPDGKLTIHDQDGSDCN